MRSIVDSRFVYVWPNGHVALMEEAKRCRLDGVRPVLIGFYMLGDKLGDASRRIGARSALDGSGHLIVLEGRESMLEEMCGALSSVRGELIEELVVCLDCMKKLL
jgi:hypothetical protein